MKRALAALFLLLGVGSTAFGAVFIVPDDAELVQKSNAIVVGRVASAEARKTNEGIETVYRVHVDRTLKGLAAGSIDIVSPGGVVDGKFVMVSGAAHFDEGDKVLLFLVQHKGKWTPTDMTLGKFRFVTSTGGQSLIVRDEEDVVGFDRQMNPHVERVRREAEFLRFIEGVVHGARDVNAESYFVSPKETVIIDEEPKGFDVSADATFAAATYAMRFGSTPGRWASTQMSASLARPFYKNSAQSAIGLGDGGVAQITSTLAAWTNDCSSAVNLVYSGTVPNLINADDNINVVVYNDPTDLIAGTWSGSGVVARTYLAGGITSTFDGGTWVNLTDTDIVVQAGLTGTESFMNTALTHEVGHAVGIRHANQHYDGSACQNASEECTSAAIMNSSVGSAYGFTLQPYDLNAIRAIYPHTCTTTAVTRYDLNGDARADIYWRNTASGQNWTYMMNGNVLLSSLATRNEFELNWKVVGIADFDADGKSDVLWRNDATGVVFLYKMDGATATAMYVGQEPNLNFKIVAVGDFDGDGDADIYWRNSSTGQNWIYLMNGATIQASLSTRNEYNTQWKVVAVGDFNGDGKDDLFWRNDTTGVNYVYQMNGAVATGLVTRNESNLQWKVVGAGDLNGDGRDDVVWRNDSTGQNYLYQMNGAAVTAMGIQTESNLAWKVANVADFDGDGKADILWRNDSSGQNWLYRMNGAAVTASQGVQQEPNLNWKIQR